LGGDPAAEVTAAVKATDCPTSDGFGDEVRVVVVEVMASPLYLAEME
jgi:hypothetical protein